MTTLYKFHCYEDCDPTYPAALTAHHTSSSRIGYFDTCPFDLSFDILKMAISPFRAEGEILVGLSLHTSPELVTYYCRLDELADAISLAQEEVLWGMLCRITRSLPEHLQLF
jgi:hypothetical protein